MVRRAGRRALEFPWIGLSSARTAQFSSVATIHEIEDRQEIHARLIHSNSQAHYFLVASSKAGVASATGGKSFACTRSQGLQALMMARLFHSRFLSFSEGEIIGSSGLLQHCRRISISVAGSERVLNAQITSSLLDGSISSSTTMEYRFINAPAWHCTAMVAACVACPAYFCSMLVTTHMRLAPASEIHTPFTPGIPARRKDSFSSADRRTLEK